MTEKRSRASMLDLAAESLRVDESTREAMPWVEHFIDTLAQRGLTWDDVPEKFNVGNLFTGGVVGKLALRVLRRSEGFRIFEAAINDPDQRHSLLSDYVECWQIAVPEDTERIVPTVQYLQHSQSR